MTPVETLRLKKKKKPRAKSSLFQLNWACPVSMSIEFRLLRIQPWQNWEYEITEGRVLGDEEARGMRMGMLNQKGKHTHTKNMYHYGSMYHYGILFI